MRFNLISNLNNGVGLERDYRLLRQHLEARGHEVRGVQFNSPAGLASAEVADINIFLEVIPDNLWNKAAEHWLVPNPEWYYFGWDKHLTRFRRVLAKTRDAERIFRGKVGERCQYIGWEARDLYNPAIVRERKFLHVAGKSRFKNTEAVIQAWRRLRFPLTIISEHFKYPECRCLHRVSDTELAQEMNSHKFHLMPSGYEGFGHALHEALGVGAVLLTTDAPPMNESPALLIPPRGTRNHNGFPLQHVVFTDIVRAVQRAMTITDEQIAQRSAASRERFLQDNREFVARLEALI